MHHSDDLEDRKLISDAIAALFPANVHACCKSHNFGYMCMQIKSCGHLKTSTAQGKTVYKEKTVET